MNPPEYVDDPSLLLHEPLCTYVAVVEAAMRDATRSAVKGFVSEFVKAMQQDVQAAAAAKAWAYLVFKDVLSDGNRLEVMDRGTKLYEVFFEYQRLLSTGLRDGNTHEARKYQNHVLRKGIGAIKLKNCYMNTRHFTGGRGGEGSSQGHSQRAPWPHKVSGRKKVRRQVETGVQPPDAESTGNVATSASLGSHSHSTMGSSAQDTLGTGARLSSLSAATPGKRPTSKKEKKRKASSQKPPVITASDVSGDDNEKCKTHVDNIANIVSHRVERIAPSPRHQLSDALGRVDLAHRFKRNKQPCEDAGASLPQSALARFWRGDVASPGVEGEFSPTPIHKDRKHHETRTLGFSTRLTRARSDSGMEIEPVRDRATGGFCRALMPTLDGEPGSGFKSAHDSQAADSQESTIQGSPVAGPSSIQETVHIDLKPRKKRARHEFETKFVVSHEKLSPDAHESLGPDIRVSRPLPQKVRVRHLVVNADGNAGIYGTPCGVPSPECADQLPGDGASDAPVVLREEVGPDLPDWTQGSDHDTECDDVDEHDQDEVNEVWVTTVASAPAMVVPRPSLTTIPRIWARSRQEVCESFEYFRSYHSGVYSKGDIVRGYLLGAYAASRDIFHHGGKLIISHGGGKSQSILDSRKGPKRYQTDQDQEASDKSVRALLKTCKTRRPVVLLADDKYALFPYDLASTDYTYVVLGLYWISHAWAECQPGRNGQGHVVRWKFAFHWCEGQDNPWWEPKQEMTDIATNPLNPISGPGTCLDGSSHTGTQGDLNVSCENCQEHSPFIYKQGWMCLNPRCSVFWSIDGEDPGQLDYREEFLSPLPRKFETLPNLTPPRVAKTLDGVTTTYAFSKGWHCTGCGRLSCRYKWERWECSHCQSKYVVDGRLRSPKEFWNQRPPKGFLHSQIGKDSGIVASKAELINLGIPKGFTNHLTYVLPHNRGKIHLILGTQLSNRDADNIFQLYQQQASTGTLELRRYPLRNHRARGQLLTNYFSQNSGEPYQYIGGSGQTIPFSEAPECVRQALALIKERSSLALRADVQFNEILSAAYMERQKMSFHSDSEKGLGPIVASLSLGSAALMHFRLHVTMDDPGARSTYALTLFLRHGDVLVMEGEGVQKYYEHTVIPMNFRIAATARCIGST